MESVQSTHACMLPAPLFCSVYYSLFISIAVVQSALYPVIGPLWCGQGTVPHTTLSDLLPTDVLLSPIHAEVPVGAGEETVKHVQCTNQ